MSTTTRKAPKSTVSTKSKKVATTTSKAKTSASKKNEAAKAAPTTGVTGKTPAASAGAAPTVVAAPQAVVVGPMLRKKELVDLVVSQSGQKKKVVKPVVETMLAVLGEALGENRELNLPPLGRVRVRREKELPNGRVVVAKIRQRAVRPDNSSEASEK